jgi:hypothetical protein
MMRPANNDFARWPLAWRPLMERWRNVVTSSTKMPDRFMLWVDAVGAYLVCLQNEIALGQPASAGATPDVPILGDLSRRHAVIRREGESYWIEALRPVQVDGRAVAHHTPLLEGSTIDLGAGVRLKFRRPHPLSSTARLEFASRHRTQPSTNGILLMAETCILGPAHTSHVVTSNWEHEVVLFRKADELCCRTSAKIRIDGMAWRGGNALKPRSRVEGEEFAFSLEPVTGQAQ